VLNYSAPIFRSPFAQLLAAAALFLAAAQCPAQVEPTHRDALLRYLQASRTTVLLRHFGLSLAIRDVAVKRWGFVSAQLGGAEIDAIQAHIADGDLENRLIEAHRARLSAEDAVKIAEFYESEPGRRIVAANLAAMLPPGDPLVRAKLPPPGPAEKEAFETFLVTPAGARLNAVGAALTKEVLQVQDTLADLAVERYVAERKLPNRRTP
jgi:hypothetical protein